MADKNITLESTAKEVTTKFYNTFNKESDLHDLMDKDFDRWNLEKTSFDTHTGAINVCTNDPRTFADDVQSTMSRANRQIIVRMAERDGGSEDDLPKLEVLLDFAFEKADELLARKLLPPLRDTVIWHGLLRACRAGRFLAYNDGKGGVIFDFMPWDPRWIAYAVGGNGLIWAGCKFFRTEDTIVDEYGRKPTTSLLETAKKLIPGVSGKDNFELIDFWAIPDPKKPTEILNCVVNGDIYLKDPEILDLPSMPISIRPVAVRPPIASTSGTIAAGLESIYAPNRGTYDLLNELLSIEATKGKLLAKQPVINYFKDGGHKDLKDTVLQAEAIINVPDDKNRLEPMPMKEIPITLLDMIEKLNAKRERAEVPHMEIGKPPPSGTLFSLVAEAGAKIYVPQLRNLSLFYADICHLMEEQLIAGKLKVDIETEVERKYHKVKVTPIDLKKPHIIKVEFTDRTPWTELETYQIADMAKRQGLPDEFIWEYILKLADPKGLADMAAVEIAEHSPALMRLRAIKTLIAQGRQEEAQTLIEEMYTEWVQQQQMQVATETPPSGGALPPGGTIPEEVTMA